MILTATSQASLPAQRIISLVPSQTELLHYFGLENETLGITKFCIHPDNWYRNKIRVGGTKEVDIQKIASLQPDLIIANKEENVREQVEELARRFPVWVTDVNNLEDAVTMIGDLGLLTGQQAPANELASRIRTLFGTIGSPGLAAACYLIWKDPYMVAASGTFIDDILCRAGFKNVFAQLRRYPVVTIDSIRAAKPAVILLSSEPYPFREKHLQEMQEQFPDTLLFLVDGEMFSWYGSRLLHTPGYLQRLTAAVAAAVFNSRPA